MNLILPVLRHGCAPDQNESLNDIPNSLFLGYQEQTRTRSSFRQEALEMHGHGSGIVRDQNAALLGGRRRTDGSSTPANPASFALRKSIAGSRRRVPVTIA